MHPIEPLLVSISVHLPLAFSRRPAAASIRRFRGASTLLRARISRWAILHNIEASLHHAGEPARSAHSLLFIAVILRHCSHASACQLLDIDASDTS